MTSVSTFAYCFVAIVTQPYDQAVPAWQQLLLKCLTVQGHDDQSICAAAERMPGGIKLARTPMAASRLSLGGSPLHPSSPTLHPTALPITFQVLAQSDFVSLVVPA